MWSGKTVFSAAKSQNGVLESARALMIQNLIFDAKANHERLLKQGLVSEAFNEARTREEVFSKITRAEPQSETYQIQQKLYQRAFDARDTRDSYLPLLPSVPVITGLFFVAIPWVLRGFKKS